ncbi:MAG: aminopeptidase P family protein [Tepidiformaceae bacterium]
MTKFPLSQRRAAVARSWDLRDGAALIPSGLPVPVPGSDQVHSFHPHPEFTYLAGVQTAGSVLAFDSTDGWSLFAPVAGQEERVWVGPGERLEELARSSGLDAVRPLSELHTWLESHRAEPIALLGNRDLAQQPWAYAIDGWSALELALDFELADRLSDEVSEARRAKDALEIDCMRTAVAASVRGHLAALRLARPGMTERQLQIELESEFFRAGSARTAYGSIVGSGPNAAILHSSPSARTFVPGDLLLIDAGAEHNGYASDVSRTFPVDAAFTGIQRDLYQLVHDVQAAAIAAVRPGVEYRDLHLAACLGIASGLVDLGILRGGPEDLVERDAHALFFVHGLGHMLGLATHDAGGCLAGRAASDRFGLKWLRADLPLEPGYVVTIEPGIYFIEALLKDPRRRETFADAVNWPLVDSLADFGGIRIEDDVLVTESGADVLTAALPSAIAQIEAIRAEALSS